MVDYTSEYTGAEIDEALKFSHTKRFGNAHTMRNTLNALALVDDTFTAATGPGGTDYFPRSITASQSGTTVTASASVFNKIYVGARIIWDSGEQAVITEVDNSGSSYADITTATVDRSQTVSSSAATIKAPNVVGVTYGDSVGLASAAAIERVLYHSLGFAGYIIQANISETSSGAQIVNIDLAGGASDASNIADASDYPWGQRWEVPSSGTLTFEFQPEWSAGSRRDLRHGLDEQHLVSDTALIVWERAAGAFTVQRKRRSDNVWETVATVADASTGTTTYNSARYSHDQRNDWQYRITGTSGTIAVPMVALLNESVSGYLHWPLSRGGEQLEDFADISSADFAELCAIVGQPRFRIISTYDQTTPSSDATVFKSVLDADRTLWASAAPMCDHVWLRLWEPIDETTGIADVLAYNEALDLVIEENGDTLVSITDVFGDYETEGSKLGFIRDKVHPSDKGGALIAHAFLRALGVADFPTVKNGRNVLAKSGEFGQLSIRGIDVDDELQSLHQFPVPNNRGASWLSGTAILICEDALSSAVGTDDFSIMLHLTMPLSGSLCFLANAGADATSYSGTSRFVIYTNSNDLIAEFYNGSSTSYRYTMNAVLDRIGGETGVLLIRFDTSEGRISLDWNGRAIMDATVSVVGSGDALGTWSGVGTQFGIIQGSSVAVEFFGAAMWLSHLTDAQAKAITRTGVPGDTSPEFWWTFREQIGRYVLDYSGNKKDAIFRKGNPNQYNIGTGVTWSYPVSGQLTSPWAATFDATTTLMPGDDVIAQYSSNRDMLLPAAPAVGDRIRVTKATNTARVRVTQPALHQILSGDGTTVGTDATTIGTSGYIEFTGDYDRVELICTVANSGSAYKWVLVEASGLGVSFV